MIVGVPRFHVPPAFSHSPTQNALGLDSGSKREQEKKQQQQPSGHVKTQNWLFQGGKQESAMNFQSLFMLVIYSILAISRTH